MLWVRCMTCVLERSKWLVENEIRPRLVVCLRLRSASRFRNRRSLELLLQKKGIHDSGETAPNRYNFGAVPPIRSSRGIWGHPPAFRNRCGSRLGELTLGSELSRAPAHAR